MIPFHEGFYSLLDAEPRIVFERFDRGSALAADLKELEGVRRIQAFSKGFWKMQLRPDGYARITDLRMGQEPSYTFDFAVAQRGSAGWVPVAAPRNVGGRPPDVRPWLSWLWRRMLGDPLPPPR